jgi:hypothetical protein
MSSSNSSSANHSIYNKSLVIDPYKTMTIKLTYINLSTWHIPKLMLHKSTKTQKLKQIVIHIIAFQPKTNPIKVIHHSAD